jgi:radical SAM protein with 4Fe4S-binding SPASM domain
MGKMPWTLFEKIIVEFAGLIKQYDSKGDVGFCLMSEPFVEKEIIKYTEFVLKHGLELNFTTNASLLTPIVIDRLLQVGFNGNFHISCHGIEEDTYQRVMGIPLAPVLENIDYLIDHYPKNKIHIRAYPFGWKKGEKGRVKKYWRVKGVKLAGGVVISRAGLVDNLKILPHRKIFGCDWNRPLWHMVISYNGDVRLCCMDMERKTGMGNVAEQSLEEVWNSRIFKNYLAKIYLRENSEKNFICKQCECASTRFSGYKSLKIPRKIRRHFKKKHFEHLNLDHLKSLNDQSPDDTL